MSEPGRTPSPIPARIAGGAPRGSGEAPEAALTAVTGWGSRSSIRAVSGWLRASRLGLVTMALVVGAGAGLGAVGFRWLIFAFTWLATGHQQFGQQGRIGSIHLPFLGIWFLLLIPVVGGLLYGPLISRFAPEARGHGVPEVMLAVAENGGRIRPPVTVVKALASAICIAAGGSVGREGPIVQIGSAFASSIGQFVRMSETRLRIIVACGAAAGISATFNAPITGLFFGFEIILREFSLDALFATILASFAGDLVSQLFFGTAPFFSSIPHDLSVRHDYTYLLLALLGVLAALVGYGFKTVLYKLEDLADDVWNGRPQWARPVVGGLGLGVVLLALPQTYGVGYPVMDKAVSGHIVLWLLVVLMIGKIVAVSVTLSIGGSGGIFAPSLFTGAMGGIAFGVIVQHLFGPVVSSPAIFGVVAMGAVFGAAAQAPLTAIASVVEMTGNFTLILPVMLSVGIATALSKRLSHGSIYTTKLLRRGIDIERVKPTNVLQLLTVSDAMIPIAPDQLERGYLATGEVVAKGGPVSPDTWARVAGTVLQSRQPQAIFADETLEQALRQLVLYGRVGLPVLSSDGEHLRGWVTRNSVLGVLADQVGSSAREAVRGTAASEFYEDDPKSKAHVPRTPLDGYETVEITMRPGAPGIGRRISEIEWPPGAIVVAVSQGRELLAPNRDIELRSGERVIVLSPTAEAPDHAEEAANGRDGGR